MTRQLCRQCWRQTPVVWGFWRRRNSSRLVWRRGRTMWLRGWRRCVRARACVFHHSVIIWSPIPATCVYSGSQHCCISDLYFFIHSQSKNSHDGSSNHLFNTPPSYFLIYWPDCQKYIPWFVLCKSRVLYCVLCIFVEALLVFTKLE